MLKGVQKFSSSSSYILDQTVCKTTIGRCNVTIAKAISISSLQRGDYDSNIHKHTGQRLQPLCCMLAFSRIEIRGVDSTTSFVALTLPVKP